MWGFNLRKSGSALQIYKDLCREKIGNKIEDKQVRSNM